MAADGWRRFVKPQEAACFGWDLAGQVVEDLRHQAEDDLGSQRGRHLALAEPGEPTQLLQRVADGLGESRDDLVHADTDLHVRHPAALGCGERGELSGLTDHHIGAPTLDRLDKRGQRGLRINPREHLTDHEVVGLFEAQGRQLGHDRTDQPR